LKPKVLYATLKSLPIREAKIEQQLNISIKTVEFYKANITRKVAKVEPVLSRAGRLSYTSK
jgi:FixJ family two-component response regulator